MNRDQRPLLFVENEMARLADAELAMAGLWARLGSLCSRPAITLEDVDAIGDDFHCIEAGLATARHVLQVARANTAQSNPLSSATKG